MKKNISSLLIFSVFLGVFFLVKPSPVYAAATIYLSPASNTVNVGDQLSVAIRLNSGGVSIRGVQANLSYPTSKLEFVNIDATGSAFEIQFQNVGGSGLVKIARTTATPVSGDNLVARVIFKANSSGSSSISFASGTTIVRSSDNKEESSTKVGGTYNISGTGTPIPPTVDIKANSSNGPVTINYNTSATLSWTSTNAIGCTASNGWSGTKVSNSSQSTGNLNSSKTFTLTCTGPGGSASDSVVVNVGKIADLNSDGKINIFDLSILLSRWGSSDVTADLNGSGKVDIFDLSILLSRWGT